MKMKSKFNFQDNLKGFTLTELLVTIAIFLIIITAIYSVYNLSQKSYRESESIAEINQNGRVILERIIREIRQSKTIVTELSDSEVGAVDSVEFQNGHDISSVNYIKYFIDDIQNIIYREEVAYYFSVSGDPENPDTYVSWNSIPPPGETLESLTLNGPDAIGEYVVDLDFWGTKNINVRINLEKNSKNLTLKTKVFGRNL